jgi:Uma2 family endonuclease
MSAVAQRKLVSVAEYLALEETSVEKHEWFNGEIFAMAGGTPQHADIITNINGAFWSRLRGHRCRGSSSDQRVTIEATGLRTYPDFLVKRPPERFDEHDRNALLNPHLIVEVSSPSTQNYDRTSKFDNYKMIGELESVLFVSSQAVRVEHFRRAQNGEWILWTGLKRSDVLRLPSLDLLIEISEFYEGLQLSEGLSTETPPVENE